MHLPDASTDHAETIRGAVPVLETERLVMRGFAGEDFEPMAAFYADPMSSFYGGPCSREEAWRKFAMYPGHWALRDGAMVGRSALSQDRTKHITHLPSGTDGCSCTLSLWCSSVALVTGQTFKR